MSLVNDDIETDTEEELPEAEVEQRNYAVAYCPNCNDEHEVSTCCSGEESCDSCGTRFAWNTAT